MNQSIIEICIFNEKYFKLESNEVYTSLKAVNLTEWKLDALELKEQLDYRAPEIIFDEINLKEEYRTDNYEHLWIKLNSLLFRGRYYPEFEFKIVASELTRDKDAFAENLSLSFREIGSGTAPLQAWPPREKDEFDHRLDVYFRKSIGGLELSPSERISSQDKLSVESLIDSLPPMLERLEKNSIIVERPYSAWKKSFSNEYIGSLDEAESSEAAINNNAKLADQNSSKVAPEFIEQVDLGGYQHLLFEVELGSEIVKLSPFGRAVSC